MENKTSKYFKYAIGEIVLVVIGILIALQVNNWNENYKLKKEEHKRIQSLIKEIEWNSEELANVISYNDSLVKQSTNFLDRALSDAVIEFNPSQVPPLFRYYAKIFEHNVLDNLLNNENRVNISDDTVLNQLNDLRFNYERYERTLKYTDDYWNTKVLDFFNDTGLGVYLTYDDSINYNPNDQYLDKRLLSTLSIMSMFQETLLLSRRDLQKTLKKTLNYLEDYKALLE